MNTASTKGTSAMQTAYPVLNAFAFQQPQDLQWEVALYNIKPIGAKSPNPRANIKDVFWKAKKAPGASCRGYGFVIDCNEDTVAVPASWVVPDGTEVSDHAIYFNERVMVHSNDQRFSLLFARIIKEGLKSHFKENGPSRLGPLWQDFNSFCEISQTPTDNGFVFCRRFDFDAKLLSGLWAMRFTISTAVLDARSIASYYQLGTVNELTQRIHAKLANRPERKGKPPAIRIWYAQNEPGRIGAKVYELFDPRQTLNDASLPAEEQKRRASLPIICTDFPSGTVNLDGKRCFLVLDSQITQEDHDETILEPEERALCSQKLRNFVSGCSIFDCVLELAPTPVRADTFKHFQVTPPAVHVQGEQGVTVVGKIIDPSPVTLQNRVNERSHHIKRFGFYESRPIDPLLAVPDFLGKQAAAEIQNILNMLLESRGIPFRFAEPSLYRDVQQIVQAVRNGNHDTLFAVLKEGRNGQSGPHDTHEQIKQRIGVPSQCIYHDNALFSKHRHRTFKQIKEVDPRAARRMQSQLDLALGNLLVKAHWFPFLPAESFHYNAHVAIDVGGKLNNQVVSCFGYGFKSPAHGLFFKPDAIPLDVRQTEPVHPDALFNGLLRQFETVYTEISEDGEKPDFDRILFIRDGQLQGAGDEWNEQEALRKLHAYALSKNWISGDSVWTAVEVMKAAEGWRLALTNGQFANPLVGFCCCPFAQANEAILCTTGQPYLSQGTACPLKIRILNIHGDSSTFDVAQDLFWEADMCFTKPDMGMSLPWTLHIADTGALQLSRSYRISGITV